MKTGTFVAEHNWPRPNYRYVTHKPLFVYKILINKNTNVQRILSQPPIVNWVVNECNKLLKKMKVIM